MSRPIIEPTGKERVLHNSDIIVSKTDRKGIIKYANRTFLDIADYGESDVLDRPHNVIRHPDMPGCIFQLLWDRIAAGHEIFCYVKNLCANGDHYWVFAHVTPSLDADGAVTGYHSTRRAVDRGALDIASDLYAELRAIERAADSPKAGLAAGQAALEAKLAAAGMDYDRFSFDGLNAGRAAA